MHQKYILLLILPRCFTAPVHDESCVIYPFEEDFFKQFTSEYRKCPEKWKLGYYSSISVRSPHRFSRTFISPSSLLSCVISYKFPMTASGIVEVNLYVDIVSNNDLISIEIHRVASGSNTVVGEKTISSMSEDFISGWVTVKITLSGSGSFMGYILLKGKATDGSKVLVDSFRYIPPLYDKELCVIYDNSIHDTSTEFYDLIEQSTDPEALNLNLKTSSEITENTIFEGTHANTVSITYPDIAMNMLDSTTEFHGFMEQSTDQTTQGSLNLNLKISSEIREDYSVETNEQTTSFTSTDITKKMFDSATEFLDKTEALTSDITKYQSMTDATSSLLQTSQIITNKGKSTQESKTDTLIVSLDSTTVVPKTIKGETDVSTLLVADSNNVRDFSVEGGTATLLPETLNNYLTRTDLTTELQTTYANSMPDSKNETISTEDTDITSELSSYISTAVSNVNTTTTRYVNYDTNWDFELDAKTSTMELKLRKTEADEGTLAGTLKNVGTEIDTETGDESISSTTTEAQEETTMQTDLSQTTSIIPANVIMDSEVLANFSMYSIGSLLVIVLILTISILNFDKRTESHQNK